MLGDQTGFGAALSAANTALTGRAVFPIVRAMNGLNHICGICRGDYSLAILAGCGRLFS